MQVPDEMSVVMVWNGKPIGKAFSHFNEPIPGVFAQGWSGEVLGESVRALSLAEIQQKMAMAANAKGLEFFTWENGAGADTLYTPPFES